MSKFSRLAQAQPGGTPYPGGSPAAPPAAQNSQQPWSPDSITPYPQGPPVPSRPNVSPQPGQQRPQQPSQNTYGSPQLGVPQQQGYPPQQQKYGGPQPGAQQAPYPPSPQPPYQQPGYQPSPQPPYAGYQSPSTQPAYASYGSQYQQPQQYGGQQQQSHSQYPPQSPYQQQQYPQQGYGGPQGGPQGGPPPQGGPQQGGYPPQGGPPQQQGGPPPQQGYGGPGGPPPQASGNPGPYKQLLQATIQEKGLQGFYPQGSPKLDQIASRAPQQVATLAQQWRINQEIASDIVKLALYDVILYIDDSGSMAFEENGERIDDLKLILGRVAFATSLFDDDGIQVRFMNSNDHGNGIRSEQQVNEMVARTKFSGLTPMGRELQNKILGPLVLSPARSGALQKPILIITITDGQPTGESPSDVAKIVKNASAELERSRYGKGALAFQFAQVGNDLKAREFLGKLDEEPTIGDIIDCTSNYEVEADEMSRANPPVNLTPELWLIKLLLGSIDSSYDSKDEKSNAPRPPQGGPGGYGPPGQGYGGPPPGQYGGPPQGQYGGPPQGQYGGGPPQGQYGGGPPQGQYGGGPQQGYGQQGGYPPQQGGGYGGPPPPRY